MEKDVMQVFELVTENGLTHLACRCRPQPEARKSPEQTFTLEKGALVIAKCPFCRQTVEFDLPRRALVPVDRMDDRAMPEQLGAAPSFVFLRSAGFALNVVNGPPRCHCPRCTN
jgi:hypothetical protein